MANRIVLMQEDTSETIVKRHSGVPIVSSDSWRRVCARSTGLRPWHGFAGAAPVCMA